MNKNIIILGAGPAGLSAGLELARQGYKPIVIEKNKQVGGISKTVEFNGFRFDLGPHRFFTKSPEIKKLWFSVLGDELLKVKRLTRMYYQQKYFLYPIKIPDVVRTIGVWESFMIGLSYFRQKLLPFKEENNFEEWVTNRFGSRLYNIFFRHYTYKLWGVDPKLISAEWAAQRIKGMSVTSTIKAAITKNRGNKIKSLIESFWYPKYGAGQMYEGFKKEIEKRGGTIILNEEVQKIIKQPKGYIVKTNNNEFPADDIISSIPFTLLFNLLQPLPPRDVLSASRQLTYRSTIIINLILDKELDLKDNWVYLHDPRVKAIRLINFKNWSPYLNPQAGKTPLGLEYTCNQGDEQWEESDSKLIEKALADLGTMGFAAKDNFYDGFVVRLPKTYPVYFEDYGKHVEVLKTYLTDNLDDLQVIGRYGMYKYNNMDHSALTGIYAARNIIAGEKKYDIWSINADKEYHEEEK